MKPAFTAVDPESTRQQRWTEKTATEARAARVRRLQQLRLRRDAIEAGCRTLGAEFYNGTAATTVRLRSGLYVKDLPNGLQVKSVNPELAPSRKDEHPGALAAAVKALVEARPPLGQLVNRDGAAVPLLLAALGLAAFRTRPGDPVDLTDMCNTGKSSWAKLIGDADAPEVARRHVVDGIKRLKKLDLIRYKVPNSKNPGYEGWSLLSEDGLGQTYTVPEFGLPVPANFWLKGWAQVLTTSETLAYLMIRQLAATYSVSHANDGIGAAPRTREQAYGVTSKVYATLNELEEFGLIKRTTPRQPGQPRAGSSRAVDRFQLTDTGLDADALTTVTTRFSTHLTPARLSRYDPLQELIANFTSTPAS